MATACVEPRPLYQLRNPHTSDLCRLMDRHFETFQQFYDHRFSVKYGFWLPIFEQSVRAYLQCGDPQEGLARIRCPDCHHEIVRAFSCEQRRARKAAWPRFRCFCLAIRQLSPTRRL